MVARPSPAPSPAALAALGCAELQGLAAMLEQAEAGASVHGARRQIKRLRSLLRLLREELGEEAFSTANGALRTAADALAGQRRAEALVGAAGRLRGGARSYWQQAAAAHRDAHHAENELDAGLRTAEAALAAAMKVLAAHRLEHGSPQSIAGALAAGYRKARKELAAAFESGDAEELHEARKHVIHHLHHMQILGDHLRRPNKRAEALEVLREALGDLNDLDELSQIAAAGGPPPKPAARVMAKRREQLLKRARTSATRLFRQKPKAFQKRIGAMWTPGGP